MIDEYDQHKRESPAFTRTTVAISELLAIKKIASDPKKSLHLYFAIFPKIK